MELDTEPQRGNERQLWLELPIDIVSHSNTACPFVGGVAGTSGLAVTARLKSGCLMMTEFETIEKLQNVIVIYFLDKLTTARPIPVKWSITTSHSICLILFRTRVHTTYGWWLWRWFLHHWLSLGCPRNTNRPLWHLVFGYAFVEPGARFLPHIACLRADFAKPNFPAYIKKNKK